MPFLTTAIALALLSVPFVAADPAKALNKDFPDPSLLKDPNSSQWYSFATAGNGHKIQIASAPDASGPWQWLDIDPLAGVGPWAEANNLWAPDVQYMPASGKYVMYYSAPSSGDTHYHCVGAAISDNITGQYQPIGDAIACPTDQGGAIDPSGFYDEASGTHWVVYKIDGNAKGHGGSCGNTVEPIVSTPLMLQQVDNDGFSKIGDPIQLLDRGPADGPLIEAPNLIKTADGTYVLFFSSNCYSSDLYDISYATSTSLQGPYTKASKPLMVKPDYGLVSPGGASVVWGSGSSGSFVFHANCDGVGGSGRCMYQGTLNFSNNVMTVA